MTFDEETVGSGPDTLESQNLLEGCVEQLKRVVVPGFECLMK
jgi:hypothetical protein